MRVRDVAVAAAIALPSCAFAQGVTYAFDHRGEDNLFSFPVNDPLNSTQIGPVGGLSYAPFAMDFNTKGSKLYVINHMTDAGNLELGTVDLNTGAYTAGPAIADPAPNETGLSVDPTDETFYLTNGSNLYTLNPNDGSTVLLGTFSGMDPTGAPIGLVIDIAVDNFGTMYAHDITTDALWQIDKSDASATFIGYSGLDANFAQGMDFDPTTNLLYAAIYTGGGTGSYAIWDVTDGSLTEVLDLPSFPDPEGGGRELEMAIRVPGPASLALLALGGAVGIRRRR